MKINYTETITDIRQISSTSNMEKHQQKLDNFYTTTSNKKNINSRGGTEACLVAIVFF